MTSENPATGNRVAEDQSADASSWHRVREAIAERWPQINRDELAECENDANELITFVQLSTGADKDLATSVVREFTPQEPLAQRIANVAGEQAQTVAESAQFAYMRADECIARRPTESVLASFFAGIVLGATVTALCMRPKPEPSMWNRYQNWK